jgi:Inner membrane protein YgaP-like, transmembrane domain
MRKNMGGTDRIIRLIVAIIVGVLFWQGIIAGTLGYVLLGIATIFLLTSFISFCPLYSLVGLSTCKVRQ